MKSSRARSTSLRVQRQKNRINRSKNQRKWEIQQMMPLMILVTISFKFNEQTTPEKWLARLRKHILMLTGNLNFPVIDPTLAALTLKASELSDLIDRSANGDRLIIEQRDIAVVDVRAMIEALGHDIQVKSGGDAEKIHSAGFDTRKVATPLQPCIKAVIEKITAKGSLTIELDLKKMKMAKVQITEVSLDPSTGQWFMGKITDTLKVSINGYKNGDEFVFLQKGTNYFFRTYGWNRLGDGEYSETSDMVCI